MLRNQDRSFVKKLPENSATQPLAFYLSTKISSEMDNCHQDRLLMSQVRIRQVTEQSKCLTNEQTPKKRYTVFQVLPFKHCDNDSASTKKYSIATKNNDTLLDGVPSISIQLNTGGELELTTSTRMKSS